MPSRTHQNECILFRRSADQSIHYLLLKRAEARGGFWQPITGGVEPGERDVPAVQREMREEIGVADPVQMTDLAYQFQFSTGDGKRVLDEHVFCAELKPDAEIVLSHEQTEYRWVTYQEALGMLKWENNKKALEHCHMVISQHG